jgi:hypothetical protein
MPRAKPDMVEIPLKEYRALKRCQAKLHEIEPRGEVPPNPGYGGIQKSRFDLDPELAAFAKERLGRMTLADIVKACRERFGEARAPSMSSLHRFWVRLNTLRNDL